MKYNHQPHKVAAAIFFRNARQIEAIVKEFIQPRVLSKRVEVECFIILPVGPAGPLCYQRGPALRLLQLLQIEK